MHEGAKSGPPITPCAFARRAGLALVLLWTGCTDASSQIQLPPLPDAGDLGDALVTITRCTVREIVAARHHSCALTLEGAVYCWGGNDNGELGTPGAPATGAPVRVPLRRAAVQLSLAPTFGCARDLDASLFCWGRIPWGLISGAVVPAPQVVPPTRVSLPGNTAHGVAGGVHACALLSSGEIFCWGNAAQVGDGAFDNTEIRVSPARVAAPPELGPVRALAAGHFFTCALSRAGNAFCWGLDPDRGENAPVASLVPMPATQLGAGIHRLSAGPDTTCAVHRDGSISCLPALDAPATAALGQRNRLVAPGEKHLCVLTEDGRILCVGDNTFGQAGPDARTTIPGDTPAELTALGTGNRALAAGYAHTCAVDQTGAAHCWGRGSEGQLGDGRRTTSATPVRVELPEPCH